MHPLAAVVLPSAATHALLVHALKCLMQEDAAATLAGV
jgi:hypothetical protein